MASNGDIEWTRETYIPSKVERSVRQDAKGGDAMANEGGDLEKPALVVERNRHSKRGAVRDEGATQDDRLTRIALESGASFIDILRESAGFNSSQEAEDYLEYVAGKRDRFMQDNSQVVKDRAPGLLHADPKSHLKRKAGYYFTFSDKKTPRAPVVMRREKGFIDNLFQIEPRGSLLKNSAIGAEEEASLHPFNTIDQRDGFALLAQLVASGTLGTAHTDRSADLRSRFSEYMLSNQGVYEQMRLTEFQRAVAGLKRKVLRHVNAKYKDLPVPERADLASELTRDILRASRKTYEETGGSYEDKDRAMFSMLKDQFGEILPTPIPTNGTTGFPGHVESAVRAYATAPARAEDRGGLVPRKELYASAFGEKEEKLDADTIKLFRKSRDLMDKVLPENEPDEIDFVDLIDATASFRPLSRQDAAVDHADMKGGAIREAHDALTRQDALGGDAEGPETAVSETPVSGGAPVQQGGPRIVINPQVFNDKRDALCVAFNEAFRVVMEANGFEPVSEPTEKQRKFFADTAYADDEVQLRRTILARIATLDTSVKDPTDEQLEETAEMLEMVMETGAPQNEWEQSAVQRLHDVVVQARESTKANGTTQQPEPPEDEASTQADVGGGMTEDDDDDDDGKVVLPEQPAAPQPEQPAAPQPDTRPAAPMQKPDQGRVHAKWMLNSSFTDKDGRRVSNLHHFDRDEQGRVHAKWMLNSSFTDKDGRRVSNLHHFDRDEQGRVHAKWMLNSSFTDKDGRRVSNLHHFDRDEQGRVHAGWMLNSSFVDQGGRRVSNLHHFDRDEQGRVHAKWALDEQNA